MGSKPSGSTTTVQKSDPWEAQQPFLKQGLSEASRLYGGGVGGGAPEYDRVGYQKALDAYNASGGAGATQNADGSVSYGGQTLWPSGGNYFTPDGKNMGTLAELNKKATGAMPTLDQFKIPGTGGGTNSLLAPEYYPGKTIANQSDEYLTAQEMAKQRAIEGSPITNSAKGYLTDVLSGDYLSPDSNPFFGKTVDRALDKVQGRVNSAFGGAGRFGGGMNQQILAEELGNTANQMYSDNYNRERTAMDRGLLFAPQLANQDYYDIGQLQTVGAQKEGRAQDLINQDIAKYNYEAQLPFNALSNYNQLISGNYGGTQTSTSPYYQNNTAGLLGAGLGVASMFGGGGGLLSFGNGGGPLPWLASNALPWL